MKKRIITPTQLSLFSRSPEVGAWWNELKSRGLFKDKLPEKNELENQLLKDGIRHEELLISNLKKQGHKIAELTGKQNESDYKDTKKAMEDGFDYIWQASLKNKEMRGSADLLKRIEGTSNYGNWTYQPIECKLSSKTKTTFLVQACCYCELLTPILGVKPNHFELYLGGKKFKEFTTDNFWYWYLLLRDRFREFQNNFDPEQEPIDIPGDHGQWTSFIDERLSKSRDLMIVARMRQTQRLKLKKAEIHTIDDLAELKDGTKVKGLRIETLNDLKEQAKLQVKPKGSDGKPNYLVKKIIKDKGLMILPKPDKGDIWFDLEGIQDPVLGTQLEYLIGLCFKEDSENKTIYKAWWAHTASEEKKAFEEWVEWVENRLEKHPNLKIYHYGNYEKSAITRLAQQYSTKETIIDRWLRSDLLIDLLPIVTSAIFLGEESYSIKKVEKLYMDKRNADVKNAGDSVVAYFIWTNSGEPENPGKAPKGSPKLQIIEDYNREDCESTELLNNWLINLKGEQNLTSQSLMVDTKEEISKEVKPLESLAHKLLDELPEEYKFLNSSKLNDESLKINNIGNRGISFRAQLLLSHLLAFHHREIKVEWWTYFERKKLAGIDSDELLEDSEVIEDAIWQKCEERKSARTSADYHSFKYNPNQDLKLFCNEDSPSRLTLEIASTNLRIDAVEIDNDNGGVVLKYPKSKRDKRIEEGESEGIPKGSCTLIKCPADISKPLRDRLEKQAESWINGNKSLPTALINFLECKPVKGLVELNNSINKNKSDIPIALAEFLTNESEVTIALQGPPGTGKSSVTAKLIVELIKLDKKIAISSNSNQAINNLLLKTRIVSNNQELDIQIIKATSNKKDQELSERGILLIPPKSLTLKERVVGGTTWVFSREEMEKAFDFLIIDEAGQMSLANLLVMAQCAETIILVGDQQQLSQPTKADHPGESGKSCLEHLIKGANVVPVDKGLFLNTSWRMEPSLTNIVSELFYDNKLMGSSSNKINSITWSKPFFSNSGDVYPKKGIIFEKIEHYGCGVKSIEEIDYIEKIIDCLLGGRFEYAQFDKKKNGTITPNDILVTAPYNVQVNLLEERLKGKAKVGTVDRFQGQEAPIAIHSLTASSGDHAPRGIDFLLEPNRLNVAISRAQCLSIVIGCPKLATGLINTVNEAEKVNRLCRLMMNE